MLEKLVPVSSVNQNLWQSTYFLELDLYRLPMLKSELDQYWTLKIYQCWNQN
jgi:hypothetical protein